MTVPDSISSSDSIFHEYHVWRYLTRRSKCSQDSWSNIFLSPYLVSIVRLDCFNIEAIQVVSALLVHSGCFAAYNSLVLSELNNYVASTNVTNAALDYTASSWA